MFTNGIKPSVGSVTISIQNIASDLQSPVAMGVPGDGSGRLFICEQRGTVRIIQNGKLLLIPFLDLRKKMISLSRIYDERGLLGIAFHPNFKSNRKFYVYYSIETEMKGMNHKNVLAEFTASASNPNVAKPEGKILLEIQHPKMNHNGGQLAFGPDGYLYFSVGDGGGAGDKHGTTGNGQNLNTLLGKILRIDVSKGSAYTIVNNGVTYYIPLDNPFIRENTKPQIWAYGLRNPWRFSFDRKTGKLFCADVGQDEYEEINIIKKGGNYGWKIMEGTHCFDPKENCNKKGLEMPINEYNHSVGKSVTGGYVYRGKSFPSFIGKYIFADWTGPMFYLTETTGKKWLRGDLIISNRPSEDMRILSFGEDEQGELYILTSDDVSPFSDTGALYKLVLR